MFFTKSFGKVDVTIDHKADTIIIFTITDIVVYHPVFGMIHIFKYKVYKKGLYSWAK